MAAFCGRFASRFVSRIAFSATRFPAIRRVAKPLTFALAFGGVAASVLSWKKPADACGIIAYIGSEPAIDFLFEGLLVMQNRGYDSAGIGTLSPPPNSQIIVTKYASKDTTSDSLRLLQEHAPSRHSGHKIGIGHTRWATHGGKTDRNAHPHCDEGGQVALVHNGTVENYLELRRELEEQHHVHFASDCDTEVIAQLIAVNMARGMTPVDATRTATSRLHGTYGLAILCKDAPDTIIAACHGSPIVIGLAENSAFVASEWPAFRRWTSKLVKVPDGKLCVVSARGVQGLDLSRVMMAPEEKIEVSPAPFPHWTIREIFDQPNAIDRALNGGGRVDMGNRAKLGGLEAHVSELLPIQNLVIAACGTSLFAGIYGAALMRWLDSFITVQVFDAAEVTNDSIPKVAPGLLVISQSGETKDVHRAVKLAEELGVPRFSVVNSVGSMIANATGVGVYLNAGREYAVASTKAFTTQVTVLALIAVWFAQNRFAPVLSRSASPLPLCPGSPFSQSPAIASVLSALEHKEVSTGCTFDSALASLLQPLQSAGTVNSQRRERLISSLLNLSELCRSCIETTRPLVQAIARKIYKKEHCFVLGKGFAEPIAREGALKIKEITYMHAEGYCGGALKHGPFALIDQGLPIILIVLDDQHACLMQTAAAEVHGRLGYTIVITDKPALASHSADEVIIIPTNGPLTALLAVIPLQLLAYEIAVLRNIDPDKPRNLAKAVTVD